jgi:hypothetical protein
VANGSHSETAKGFIEKASVDAKLLCPECGGDHTRRLERKGFLQTKVFAQFGYYPWLCIGCKKEFLARKRYRRKSKNKEEYIARESGQDN